MSTFETDSNLGFLTCHPPYHGEYKNLFFIANFWSGACLEKTVELAEKLGISKNLIDEKLSPPAIGSVFWCRTDAIKKLTSPNWTVEDFPAEPMPTDGTISHALERIFPFVAQIEGFYTGWLMTDEFAKSEIENFIYYAKKFYEYKTPPPPPIPTLTAWVKYKVPEKYWFLLRPVKKVLKGILGIFGISKKVRKNDEAAGNFLHL